MQNPQPPYTIRRRKRRRSNNNGHQRRPMPQQPPMIVAAPRPARRPQWKQQSRLTPGTLAVLAVALVLVCGGLCLIALALGFGLLYSSDQVLPGVSSVGVSLGGMDEAEAANKLTRAWAGEGLLLRDGSRTWAVSPGEIGISLDAAATAAAAQDWGRDRGGLFGALRSMAGGVDIEPILTIDAARMSDYLRTAKAAVDQPAVNAGVRLVNGQAVASPAAAGRVLDVDATINRVSLNAARELADGALDLVMVATTPAINDATPLVAQANALLASSFQVDAYDPIRDEWAHWSAPPDVWAAWLTAAPASDSSTGLSLAMDGGSASAFLQANASFADERYVDADNAVAAMQDAIRRSQTRATVRIWHKPTTYTVQAGQTLAAIGEEVGIPYPYIQAENPGVNVDALSAGQTLQLPSKDVLVPLDPIPHKRIVVSRRQQHLWAYENGQVVFDWVISTGLPTSPTALGVFQVQSHDLNAYADQWNLYMPHFMGFYHPGPNMDLMNGFHGFPTRGGGYLLWTGDLGTPVTYGCVLLSLENAEALYNWAEEGVVVVVQP